MRGARSFGFDHLAALLALAAYWVCLPPGISWWDTGEAQTVPYLAGIFHPTGFPAYAIAGWIFSHVFAFGNVAWRMSLFSGVATSAAVGILAHNARKFGASWHVATLSALIFATTPIIWQHATHAGVNAFELLVAALTLHFALSGRIIQTALVAGIALATHPISAWLMPGIALVVIGRYQERGRLARTLGVATLAFLAGLALYAYLPIRSAMVTAAHLDPTADLPIPYHPIWDYDHPATVAGFFRLVSGADFHVVRVLPITARLSSYPASIHAFLTTAFAQYGWTGCLLVLVGAIVCRPMWAVAGGLLLAAFGAFPFAVHYVAVSDADKYYLVTLWIFGLLLAMGAAALEERLAKTKSVVPYIPAAVLLVLFGIGLHHAGNFLAQRDDKSAPEIIRSVLNHTPDDAMIAAPWYYATPLYYAAYIDRSLGHRLIVTNVGHREIATLAESYKVYYFPIPSTDTRIQGARLQLVTGGWPEMFRVYSRQGAAVP